MREQHHSDIFAAIMKAACLALACGLIPCFLWVGCASQADLARQDKPAKASGETSPASEFVTRNLGLDPAVFGTAPASHPGAVVTQKDSTNRSEWYATDATRAYEAAHPGRHLRYGFEGGRLTSVNLSTDFAANFAGGELSANARQLKLWLDETLAAFRQLHPQFWTHEDERWRLSYVPLCNGDENIAARISVTQLATKPQ